MRAAAQLNAVIPHGDDSDDIAVFFLEQSCSSAVFCLIYAHFLDGNIHTVKNGAVHRVLDLGKFFRAECAEMGKVESQAVLIHKGARLMDVLAQHGAQCAVEQMRCRMRAGYRLAALGGYGGDDTLADGYCAGAHDAVVQVLIALVLLDVFDLKAAELSVLDILKAEADLAVVGKLAAHFRIKRSLVKHDDALAA